MSPPRLEAQAMKTMIIKYQNIIDYFNPIFDWNFHDFNLKCFSTLHSLVLKDARNVKHPTNWQMKITR